MKFEKQTSRITTPGVDLEYSLVPWDSDIFGFPVAQIERIVVKQGADPDVGMRQFRSWLELNEVRLVSCRLGSDRLRESMLLEANGFRFVEMVYGPTLSPIPDIGHDDDSLAIVEARHEDLAAIETIAASAFATGRFLIDWRLDGSASHRRYQAWVRNSFDDVRQTVLMATADNGLIGFFVVEDRPDRSVYWHLTAISPSKQGRGFGKRVWRAMVARHHAAGLQRIDTTISAHNTAVINLYAGLGFRFGLPQMTFHWVR